MYAGAVNNLDTAESNNSISIKTKSVAFPTSLFNTLRTTIINHSKEEL